MSKTDNLHLLPNIPISLFHFTFRPSITQIAGLLNTHTQISGIVDFAFLADCTQETGEKQRETIGAHTERKTITIPGKSVTFGQDVWVLCANWPIGFWSGHTVFSVSNWKELVIIDIRAYTLHCSPFSFLNKRLRETRCETKAPTIPLMRLGPYKRRVRFIPFLCPLWTYVS